MRVPALILSLSIAGLWIACAIVYPDLPDRIPVHLDLAGNVNRTASRTPWSWFMLPTIATLTGGLMLAIAALAPRYPALYNYPGKEDVLALSGDARDAAMREVQRFILWVGVETVLVFGGAMYGIHEAAHGRGGSAAVLVSVAAMTLATPLLLALLSSRITRIVEANRPPRRR